MDVVTDSLVNGRRFRALEAMKKTEEEFGEENYPGEMGKRGRFVRKGKAEGWKEEMPQDLVKIIEHEFSAAMKKLGYE